MKRLFTGLLMLLCAAPVLLAQEIPDAKPIVAYKLAMAEGGSFSVDLKGKPVTTSIFKYDVTGTASAVTVTVTGSTDDRAFTSESTGTTVAGGTITVSGVRTGLTFTVTTLTGQGAAVNAVYIGVPLGSGGAVSATLDAETSKLIGRVTPTATDASAAQISDIVCQNSFVYDASTSGNVELVALSGTKHIYVCGYEMFSAGTVNLSLVAGTGTACASAASGATSTGTSGASAKLTPAWQFTAQTGKISMWPTHGWLLDAGSANALCLKTSAAVAAQVQVFYQQR